MADTTEFTGTQQNQRGTGLIPQAGQFLSNVQQLASQPSIQRSLPAVVAVIVLVLGLFVYSIASLFVYYIQKGYFKRIEILFKSLK